MSIRQMFPGSIVKPGFNPLAAQTSATAYNLWSWGDGSTGALGNGTINVVSSPVQVGTTALWTAIESPIYPLSGFAIRYDGSLWSWGDGSNGVLGLGVNVSYSSPKQIGTLTTWSKVSAGNYNAYAIKTDGTLWGWGKNQSGQLGLGNTTPYSSPKQVGSLTNWLNVAGGVYCALATKTDGTLWGWGRNDLGLLGLGNLTSYSSPKQIGALTNWLLVAASYDAIYAVKTNGTLWSWGQNAFGQLGLGNRTNYSSPKQIGALTTWSKVSSKGGYFATAIKTDGTLWSWGRNQYGQLGLNNGTYYSSPKQVGSLTTWLKTASGYGSFTIAVQTNGTLWAWGQGGDGRTGLNIPPSNVSSPTQIGALTTWANVGAGYTVGYALG